MPVYNFRAKDPNRRVVQGRVKASSRDEVERKLMSRQLVLISASPQNTKKSDFNLLEINFGGISHKKVVLATRQLAFLVKASVPIAQALDIIGKNTDDAPLRRIFEELSQGIIAGKSFSASLMGYPNVFDELYVNMVRAGEEGGSLDVMLNQLATYIEKTESIKGRVKSSMMYPVFVAIVAIAIVIGMIVYLVPKFEEIFAEADQELPAITQMLVDASDFMRNNSVLLIMSVLAMGVSFVMFIKSEYGSRIWEKFLTNVPVLGSLLIKNNVARFSRTLSCLLSAGGNIVESIKIAGKSSGSVLMKDASVRVSESVEKGFMLGKSLASESIFPSLMRNMIISGEQTGNVDDILMKIAEFCEEQVDAAVDGIIKMIEPVMIVGVALVIGFIIIALYLPIFKMSGALAGG
ncbi:MAG: type II secretion system F family protein [Bdellovibrionales bacterium]|nr:type II secretion system F family protein [Bdellovibrionales bacterium]